MDAIDISKQLMVVIFCDAKNTCIVSTINAKSEQRKRITILKNTPVGTGAQFKVHRKKE